MDVPPATRSRKRTREPDEAAVPVPLAAPQAVPARPAVLAPAAPVTAPTAAVTTEQPFPVRTRARPSTRPTSATAQLRIILDELDGAEAAEASSTLGASGGEEGTLTNEAAAASAAIGTPLPLEAVALNVLVWGRAMRNEPWWPGRLTYEPNTGEFVRPAAGKQGGFRLHVQYVPYTRQLSFGH